MYVCSRAQVAAKRGVPIIVDNLHAARSDAVLAALSRLLRDRELELPDGTLLKAGARISPALREAMDAGGALLGPPVLEIPATFLVVALGCGDDPRNPLGEEVAALFSAHTLPCVPCPCCWR
jgi:hypothetical protein|eukprot:COSAG06_NODE_11215_length_1544_cov_0.740484_1_plen_122_part_00